MNIRFIGGGAMATALISGIVKSRAKAESISVIEPDADQAHKLCEQIHSIKTYPAWAEAPPLAETDLVVLAVKPQQVGIALAPLKASLASLPPLVSIAAGVRVATLSRLLDGFQNIVRLMPNTALLVNEGITACFAPPHVNPAVRNQVSDFLQNSTVALWVDDEAELDLMTALSGSGPAYVYYFMESLQNAAIELGIDPEVARKIAIRLIASSATMARRDGSPFTELRANVTSKGGTTEAAIKVLDAANLKDTVLQAVKAAHQRAVELGDILDQQQ